MKARAFFDVLPKRAPAFELAAAGFLAGVAVRSAVDTAPTSAVVFVAGCGVVSFLVAGSRTSLRPCLPAGRDSETNANARSLRLIVLAFAFGWMRAHIGGGEVPVPSFIEAWRAAVDARIGSIFAPPVSAWVAGLLLGDDSEFGDAWKEVFRKTGTSHLTAVSGYNVAVVLHLVGTAALRAPFGPRGRAAISFAAVLLFVAMTGAPASVTRAAVMAGAVLLAREGLGRAVSPIRALLLAVLLLVAVSPDVLLGDLGFRLSVLATFELVVFSEPLASVLPERVPNVLRESFGQTAAATLAVAPAVAFSFGSYSVIALPANMAVMPFIPAVTALGGGILALGGLSLPGARLLADVARPFLHLPLDVLHAFAGTPGALLVGGPAFAVMTAAELAVLGLAIVRRRGTFERRLSVL